MWPYIIRLDLVKCLLHLQNAPGTRSRAGPVSAAQGVTYIGQGKRKRRKLRKDIQTGTKLGLTYVDAQVTQMLSGTSLHHKG